MASCCPGSRSAGQDPEHEVIEHDVIEHDVIEHDIILLWGQERRVITGSDILGRLLRGIAVVQASA